MDPADFEDWDTGDVAHTYDADDLLRRDSAVLWHPYAPMPAQPPPVPVVGAQGAHLQLADGRRVVDGMSSWWAAIHGYRHPVLDAAITEQLGEMAHVMFGGITHPRAIELAERLVRITPPGLEHVFLSDSGSVAVEVAVKMAIQYWRGRGEKRDRLLAVRSGYHGDTFAAMSLCDPVTGMHHMFGSALPEQVFAPEPERDTTELARLLEAHRSEVAAVILEPVVQGAGGMRFYSPAYLAEARRLCDELGLLLIADEIATGFGRSGELFGCDHAAVSPDIMCLGKAMTGGYLSMAATLCTPAVSESVSRAESGALMHGPTFMGNALAASVAVASIDLLLGQPWRDIVGRIGAELADGLETARALPGVADVRVLGAIGVVEMTEPLSAERTQVHLLDRGVWLRPFGRLLYTMPPYVSTTAEIATICEAMVSAADV